MTSMIERVARASFDCWKMNDPARKGLEFEDLNNLEGEMEFALFHARAIIEAMREPTDEQRMAYWELSHRTEVMCDAPWERAIDAALTVPSPNARASND